MTKQNTNMKLNGKSVRATINRPKGITLIALVITIVVLIILAGVAINLSLGENGIFTKAKEAKEKYTVETIKEKIEIGIMNLEIDEVALGNEVTIELVLQELLEDGTFESIDKEAGIGNIGEYEVKLKYNKEGKVVIESIKKAEGIRITYTLEPIGYTNGDKVGIFITIQGRAKEVTKPDGLKIYSDKDVLAIDYEVTANGEYKFIIEDEQGNKQEKKVIVDTIDRLAPKDFEITAQSTDTGINITANTEDAEADGTSVKSGIEKYEYFVKLETETEYTKYETNEITDLEYGTYEVYVIAYDKAGNSKPSNTITITREHPQLSKRYVDYGIDLNDDGDTTNDWMIFYEEEDETSSNYGATYIIADYYVPYTKMTTSMSNAGMSLYKGTYRVRWASTPTYKTITNTVKQVFMYDYTGTSNGNVKAVSRLLDTAAWESDFVTEELKAKGGMAIGGPTINMWCASWNKTYPTQKVTPSISGTGYQVNGSTELSLALYTGYKTDAPNVYYPTKNQDSDGTDGYWIASPSSFYSDGVIYVHRDSKVHYVYYGGYSESIRPVVYLPSTVKLVPSGTANLWNIDYGE